MEPRTSQQWAVKFRPEFVTLRRSMRGLSQVQLAEISGIAQGTLSKVEQGLKPINEEILEKLAVALDCPTSFFCRGDRVFGAPLSAHPMFRRAASVGQKALDKLIAELNVRILHLRVFLENAEIEPELPFPSYDLDDFDGDPAEIARNVRRAWYVPSGPIPNLTEYAERAGCIVFMCDMGEVAVDGVSYRISGLPPIVFLNQRRPADRLRFSLAHELGHLVMHLFPTPAMEDEADQFASELLMPAADIGPDLSNLSLDKAAYMKPFWRVSMAALIVRATTLGRIEKSKAQWLWRQMSAKNYRTKEPASLDFPREEPSVAKGLWENLIDTLAYSPEELQSALSLYEQELLSLYNARPFGGLRLVKAV
ncbi:helix-turn-helix domain-containing protein [Robbsia andropogonis]|uniref:helix-turn-helix domain-containing protein n=1 Tax=Robbsia andropogonis TaxID=28092 RepID=UPI003D23CDD6